MTPIIESNWARSAFQLKGGIYTLTTLELHTINEQALRQQLSDMVGKAPQFFQKTPVVLDLDKLPIDATLLNLSRVRHLLHESGMLLVAVRGGVEGYRKGAEMADLAWLPAEKQKRQNDKVVMLNKQQSVIVEDAAVENENQAEELLSKDTCAKIVHKPVRSGQQVYTSGDLVVMAPVSEGAELLAGGHIHVYGPLRGRALAGVNGDREARIFCHRFEAELISICGQYKLTGNIEHTVWGEYWGKSAVVKLNSECLHIAPL